MMLSCLLCHDVAPPPHSLNSYHCTDPHCICLCCNWIPPSPISTHSPLTTVFRPLIPDQLNISAHQLLSVPQHLQLIHAWYQPKKIKMTELIIYFTGYRSPAAYSCTCLTQLDLLAYSWSSRPSLNGQVQLEIDAFTLSAERNSFTRPIWIRLSRGLWLTLWGLTHRDASNFWKWKQWQQISLT